MSKTRSEIWGTSRISLALDEVLACMANARGDSKTMAAHMYANWGYCPITDADHAQSRRQYMHVWCADHKKKWRICVAQAAGQLPYYKLHGLFAHELGHLLYGKPGEPEADDYMSRHYGIEIEYGADTVQATRIPWKEV